MVFNKWIDLAVVVGCAIVGKKINDAFQAKDEQGL